MNTTKFSQSTTVIHPAPESETLSTHYTLTANGKPVPVYECRVSAVPLNQVWPGYQRPMDQTELAAFAYCESDGPVTFRVSTQMAIESVAIKPQSRNVIPVIDGKHITFTLPGPGQYTVEVNGWHHALHVFLDALEVYSPDAEDENVLYFGPGVHHPGKVLLSSDQTVYVAGGAVVYGSFHAQGASNIKILGRGIIDVSEAERGVGGGAIRLSDCHDITIDGLILRDPDVWCCSLFGCQKATINDLKLVGLWRYNADGIDICNSQDVRMTNCFVRAFDDCIVFKGLKWGGTRQETSFHERPVRDILVEGCVLWNDWGRALEIGAETSAPEMTNIIFRDCDIIRTTHIAMDIQHGDRAAISDIVFEDIRVEVDDFNMHPRLQQTRDEVYTIDPDDDYLPTLLTIIIRSNFYSKDQQLGTVRNIAFKNIAVISKRMPPSDFRGADPLHNVEDVTIENLTLNGDVCDTADLANLAIHDFVRDVCFVGP